MLFKTNSMPMQKKVFNSRCQMKKKRLNDFIINGFMLFYAISAQHVDNNRLKLLNLFFSQQST